MPRREATQPQSATRGTSTATVNSTPSCGTAEAQKRTGRLSTYFLDTGVALVALTNTERSLHDAMRTALRTLAERGALPQRIEPAPQAVNQASARVLEWTTSFDD